MEGCTVWTTHGGLYCMDNTWSVVLYRQHMDGGLYTQHMEVCTVYTTHGGLYCIDNTWRVVLYGQHMEGCTV
jgi:hypothetical protein